MPVITYMLKLMLLVTNKLHTFSIIMLFKKIQKICLLLFLMLLGKTDGKIRFLLSIFFAFFLVNDNRMPE